MRYEWFIIIFLATCIAIMLTLWPEIEKPEERQAVIDRAVARELERKKAYALADRFRGIMNRIEDIDKRSQTHVIDAILVGYPPPDADAKFVHLNSEGSVIAWLDKDGYWHGPAVYMD